MPPRKRKTEDSTSDDEVVEKKRKATKAPVRYFDYNIVIFIPEDEY